jgi:hypothetical protein
MAWKYPTDVLHRKLAYLKTLASEDGIELSMDRWISLLKETQAEIAWETIYRTLLDMYLKLGFGFDWDDFDYPPDEWNLPDYTPPDWTPPDDWDWDNPFDPNDDADEVGKAYWNKTNYNLSYYDPPEVTLRDVERFAWSQRYPISEKDTAEYKQQSLSLKKKWNAHKQAFKSAGVKSEYVDGIEDILSIVESRILRGFFVGFAVVGISRVSKRHYLPDLFRARVDTRRTTDWKSTLDTESVLSWESIVGWARVGYCRVGKWTMILQKWVSDSIVGRVNAFWLRSGFATQSQLSRYGGIDYYQYIPAQYAGYVPAEIQTLWQRAFMLQRVDQYHYTGGKHQIKMQMYTKGIRAICDKHGIMANFRQAYTCYGNEILYLKHDSHKLYKRWKKLVTVDDIRSKYVTLGCDESVLREIERNVKP